MPTERLCMIPECLKPAAKGFLYCTRHTIEIKKEMSANPNETPETIYRTLKYDE